MELSSKKKRRSHLSPIQNNPSRSELQRAKWAKKKVKSAEINTFQWIQSSLGRRSTWPADLEEKNPPFFFSARSNGSQPKKRNRKRKEKYKSTKGNEGKKDRKKERKKERKVKVSRERAPTCHDDADYLFIYFLYFLFLFFCAVRAKKGAALFAPTTQIIVGKSMKIKLKKRTIFSKQKKNNEPRTRDKRGTSKWKLFIIFFR